MEYELETRICLSKRCDNTFRVTPTAKNKYCSAECQFLFGGNKKTKNDLKEMQRRLNWSGTILPTKKLSKSDYARIKRKLDEKKQKTEY